MKNPGWLGSVFSDDGGGVCFHCCLTVSLIPNALEELAQMIDQPERPAHGDTENHLNPEPVSCSSLPNGLSVDVEDYFQVEAFADRITAEMWPRFPSRVADNTRRVLELLGRAGSRATFFVLGWIAEREPRLVREILDAGHEVGCHSYLHRCIWRLTPEEFRADARRACAAIEDAGGQKVIGYRAPTFSVVQECLWAIEILAEQGFVYDSSVFPIRHDLYGVPDAPRFPFRWVCTNGQSLFEIPPLTVRLFGRNLPVGGGGYLRVLPMWYTRWGLRRVRQREGQSAVLYFHPWELDPGQPRLSGKWRSKFRHYFNIRRMEEKIRELLSLGRFVPLGEFLQTQLRRGPLPSWRLVTSTLHYGKRQSSA
jgi:polysaccharide deacetylase family protein (PEP-CTERM system associated)